MPQPYPDPPEEEMSETSCGTIRTYRKYACLFDEDTNRWYTHTCHPNAVAYIQVGCTMSGGIPPVLEPTKRAAHQYDIVRSDGRKKYFMGSGTISQQPSSYIRVSRND